MTNYDRVMSEMTPGKLAVIILAGNNMAVMSSQCLVCSYQEELLREGYCPGSCREGIEKWLNQEEEKDGAD